MAFMGNDPVSSRRHNMHKTSASRFGAFLLVGSLWFSAIAFFPALTAAQTVSPADASTAKKDTNGKDKAKANVAPTTAATADKGRPLSVKEDPSMIGKRNINSGDDKLFGWLGGSREKEMQVGRQLAMEVEQQSKMI